MAKAVKPIQIIDGKWYAMGFDGPPFYEECCDCSLCHRIEYRFRNGRFWVRYFRDDRRTRAARKARPPKLK